jgi:integrase
MSSRSCQLPARGRFRCLIRRDLDPFSIREGPIERLCDFRLGGVGHQVRPLVLFDNENVRFDGYIRVSRVGGRDGDSYRSPHDQREAIERLAAAHGLAIGEVVVEEDVSGGKKAEQRGLDRLVRKVESGESEGLHAHGLRHAFAVDMVRSGAPLYVVRDALGHASIATTQVYLSRVGAHEAVDAMRNREWQAL